MNTSISSHPTTHTFFALALTFLMTSILLGAPVDAFGGSTAQAAENVCTNVPVPVNGENRSFNTFVPATLDTSRPVRVVIMLHGLCQSPQSAESQTNWNALASKGRFIVVYGQGSGSWNAGSCCGAAVKSNRDDVAYLDAVINQVKSQYNVDARRIYMTGFSTGGMMAMRYACERSGNIAAIAVGSGTLAFSSCKFSKPVPAVFFTGAKDSTVPYNGLSWSSFLNTSLPSVPASAGVVAKANKCGAFTARKANSLVTNLSASCPSDAPVRVYLSAPMGHTWTQNVSAHGFDETLTAWNFLWPQHR